MRSVVSVSFLDDGVQLFRVTIINRSRGDTITPLFPIDEYL